MAIYNIRFYNYNPGGILPTSIGSTFNWAGPADAVGKATVYDPESGIQGVTLDDDSAGGEGARADIDLNGTTSTNSTVDAELVWTVYDTVTGQTFEIAQFQVEQGGATGYYTISEIPLVPGRTYEIQNYDSNPNVSAGDIAFSSVDYVAPDHTVTGTAGDDTIDATYSSDPQNDQVDDGFGGGATGNDNYIDALGGNDTVDAGLGNDTVDGGDGNDSIQGGVGDDSLMGGDGNDTLVGGPSAAPSASAENLDWAAAGPDGTNISSGFSQITGDMEVSVSFSDDGTNGALYMIESTDTGYVESGEPYDPNSHLYLYGNGDGTTSTTTIDFASAGGPYQDAVENVSFRINDIDMYAGNHQDVITVTAFDADGNPVTVTISPSGNDTVSGDTISAGGGTLDNPNDALGSVLVEIAGPVSQIVISYGNTLSGTHAIWLSDVHFTSIPDTSEGDADVLDGGAGADELFGYAGDDTLIGGTGDDTMTGGEGEDVFVLQDGSGADTVTDFDTGDDDGDGNYNDQLDVSGLTDALGNPVNAWDVVVTDDGSGNALLSFPNGETILLLGVAPAEVTGAQLLNAAGVPCFTPGTMIRTPRGEVAVETLQPGDSVSTRNGPRQVLWAGRRDLGAADLLEHPELKPVVIPQGVLGNHSPLVVSPQHAMVLGVDHGLKGDRLVRARHLAELRGPVRIAQGKRHVSYVHILLASHQVIWANGAETESFYPGRQSLKMFPPETLLALRALVPDLGSVPVEDAYGAPALPYLKRRDLPADLVLRRADAADSRAA